MAQVLCPKCGEDLCKRGIGHDCHYYAVEYGLDDFAEGTIGDTIENYCPECGETISNEQYDKVMEEWEKPTKEVKND